MISVDYRSRIPLYQQLVDNIEDLAARGFLPPDSQLPSVRALAMELSINPNTIQRAYTELERRGVIYSLAGRGSFVNGSPEGLLQAKRQRLLTQMAALVREGLDLGLTPEDLLQTCRAAAREKANNENVEAAQYDRPVTRATANSENVGAALRSHPNNHVTANSEEGSDNYD